VVLVEVARVQRQMTECNYWTDGSPRLYVGGSLTFRLALPC
jgi:hypothetical protein